MLSRCGHNSGCRDKIIHNERSFGSHASVDKYFANSPFQCGHTRSLTHIEVGPPARGPGFRQYGRTLIEYSVLLNSTIVPCTEWSLFIYRMSTKYEHMTTARLFHFKVRIDLKTKCKFNVLNKCIPITAIILPYYKFK